jgi:cysteine desulfurase family protein (TIGR01976 family)
LLFLGLAATLKEAIPTLTRAISMPPSEFPIDRVRARFPALAVKDEGRPRIYFDNPAGTQVPAQVLERTRDTLTRCNANLGGQFASSIAAGMLVEEAHAALADFYGATNPRTVVFGQNMTTLTFHVSRCLGRRLRPGDEIVVSRMDHDANVAPWLLLAEEKGLTVRFVDFNTETYEFDDDALDRVLSGQTRLFAIGYASNLTGTVNELKTMAGKAKAAGALVYVDAVQLAPHYGIDVHSLGCDFLVTSAYKWFGPHQGILWGSEAALQETFAYKVRPAGEQLGERFETGTLSHEGMAGALGAIEYLEELGQGETRAHRISDAFRRLSVYEQSLTLRLIEGLKSFRGLTIHGITSANAMHRRVPTVSLTWAGHHPAALAKALAQENIFVWSGHNYAIEPVRRLGLLDKGGVLRIGLAHYNTIEEVDALLAALARIARQ